jgi:hypothetical protein
LETTQTHAGHCDDKIVVHGKYSSQIRIICTKPKTVVLSKKGIHPVNPQKRVENKEKKQAEVALNFCGMSICKILMIVDGVKQPEDGGVSR